MMSRAAGVEITLSARTSSLPIFLALTASVITRVRASP